MSSQRTTLISLSVLVVFGTTTLAPLTALASTKGRRNTALALTASAVYSVAKGKKTAALVSGAGAAYAWKRYTDSRKDDAYRKGYRAGHHTAYRSNKYSKSKYSKKHYGWFRGKHKGWQK